MAKLTKTGLLKKIITYAIEDRIGYIHAVGDESAEAEVTKKEIARIMALQGMSFSRMMHADTEALWLACIFSEYWFSGLADADSGPQGTRAHEIYEAIKEFRLEYFGRTRHEALLAMARSVPIQDILDNPAGLAKRQQTPAGS